MIARGRGNASPEAAPAGHRPDRVINPHAGAARWLRENVGADIPHGMMYGGDHQPSGLIRSAVAARTDLRCHTCFLR
jgi:hypothetical protein